MAKIFIGSSNEAGDFATLLAADLKKRGHDAVAWTDAFGIGKSVESSFAALLDANDYFVVILTPDISGRRGATGSEENFAVPNVLFELGAAYGRHGLTRALLLRDERVKPPSDVHGVVHIKFTHEPGNAHGRVRPIGGQIDDHIRENPTPGKQAQPQPPERISQLPIRWLALIKCAPARQSDFVVRMKALKREALNNWNVTLERYGVVWGLPDNFLLSHCPTVENYVDFVRHLRQRLEGVVTQVDSRLIFPTAYWSNPSEDTELSHQELMLLSCKPAQVERVFDYLKMKGGSGDLERDYKLQIAATGIAMGDADVFLITRAEDEGGHRSFVQKPLQGDIKDWLSANTTSMPITDAWPV